MDVGLFLVLFWHVIFFWQHLYNSTQDMLGTVTLSEPAREKDPPKKDPTTIKTKLHPESQHKRHKGHPKSIKFRRSRRLPH